MIQIQVSAFDERMFESAAFRKGWMTIELAEWMGEFIGQEAPDYHAFFNLPERYDYARDWTTFYKEVVFFFKDPGKALLFKLTWCGK